VPPDISNPSCVQACNVKRAYEKHSYAYICTSAYAQHQQQAAPPHVLELQAHTGSCSTQISIIDSIQQLWVLRFHSCWMQHAPSCQVMGHCCCGQASLCGLVCSQHDARVPTSLYDAAALQELHCMVQACVVLMLLPAKQTGLNVFPSPLTHWQQQR
jgi:hypothetical protein